MMCLTDRRLTGVYEKAEKICFGAADRIVLMSDCHRGAGNWGDNFLRNQTLFHAALQYYIGNGFTYIELGDGDELWENRKLESIIQVHGDVLAMMSQMYGRGRFYMIFGNHDKKKRSRKYLMRRCKRCRCDLTEGCLELFPDMDVREGIVLWEQGTGNRILLTHGHQGELLNDVLWPAARFLVRYVWRRMELTGVQDPTSTAKNYRRKGKRERALGKWAEKQGILLIAGHTHRPALPPPGAGLYANDGSCVHPRCITAIEIERGALSLVKWSVLTRPDRSLYVGRELMAGPYPVRDYFREPPQA